MVFSGIWNWVLNLFDSNHYQIIDWERYRSEDQFYSKQTENKEDKLDDSNNNTDNTDKDWNLNNYDLGIQNHEINNEVLEPKKLDNEQEISIKDKEIWINLSDHEINNSEDFKLDL